MTSTISPPRESKTRGDCDKTWPAQAVDGWLKIGDIYASTEIKDEARALDAYKAALAAAPARDRPEIRARRIPAEYHNKL